MLVTTLLPAVSDISNILNIEHQLSTFLLVLAISWECIKTLAMDLSSFSCDVMKLQNSKFKSHESFYLHQT